MTEESSSRSPSNGEETPSIPIEFVSEEELALIEAALIEATSIKNSRSVEFGSITFHSKRRLSSCSETLSQTGDIEDLGDVKDAQKKRKQFENLLHRFRRNRGLAITDITATEWCQKQMEFVLLRGRPRDSKAMKAGKARHTKLEEEVIKRSVVRVEAQEDSWALKFMNFIVCANQLLFEGLTRELPVLGFVEGVWLVGQIDEIRMPAIDTVRNPLFVETKTRSEATLPREPQKRTGRLQLMCYKYLWDSLVTKKFPSSPFFTFFGLNPRYVLSKEIQEHAAASGFPSVTLEDVVRCFQNACCMLPPGQDQLLLRYEFQRDHTELGEEYFTYDHVWLMSRIKCSLGFWLGESEATYVPEEERWKCWTCNFASVCPINTTTAECSTGNDSFLDPASHPASGVADFSSPAT